MQEKCKHLLDKNNKYCLKCGMIVVNTEFITANEQEQKEWEDLCHKVQEKSNWNNEPCGRKECENCYPKEKNIRGHETQDGWCCACEYDITVMNKQIEDTLKEIEENVKMEIEKLIQEEILICYKEGTPTSRLTSLSLKIRNF